MQDAWRAYLELALGLTEASRRRAEKVAKDLLDRGGATAGQVQSLVEELLETSRSNREELVKLVRYEVERAVGAVGLATADDVAELTARVRELERRLRESPAAGGERAPAKQTTGGGTTQKATAKKTTAKKAPAKKATAKQAPAKKSTAKQAPAKKSASQQAKKSAG